MEKLNAHQQLFGNLACFWFCVRVLLGDPFNEIPTTHLTDHKEGVVRLLKNIMQLDDIWTTLAHLQGRDFLLKGHGIAGSQIRTCDTLNSINIAGLPVLGFVDNGILTRSNLKRSQAAEVRGFFHLSDQRV